LLIIQTLTLTYDEYQGEIRGQIHSRISPFGPDCVKTSYKYTPTDSSLGVDMKRFIEGANRSQCLLLPEILDDYIAEDNPVRVIEAYIQRLDLAELAFKGVEPKDTGRPAYHPSILLMIYIYGYLNRIHSSRRLERETQRNVELMWLTGRLTPDFKNIADFRKDNGKAIRNPCQKFILLCRKLELFSQSIITIDGSKFKAVNWAAVNI